MSQVEDLKPLTSLRFFAAIAIVLLHARQFFDPIWPWLHSIPITAAQGVSFFFVLSGFILTHVYKSKPWPGYGRFIATRIARLWPLHFFATLLLFLFVPGPLMTYSGDGIFDRNFVLLFNLSLVQTAVPTTAYVFSWNPVSWSISTEYFFYFAFPFLLVGLERNWIYKLVALAVIGAASYPILLKMGLPPTSDDPFSLSIYPFIYANPISRGFQFFAGMAAWAIWNQYLRHRRSTCAWWTCIEFAVAIALIFWLGAFDDVIKPLPTELRMWATTSACTLPFAIFVAAMASGRGLLGRALALSPIVWLGHLSYAIYLLHWVLMKIFAHQLPAYLSTELAFFGALFAISAFSFYFVEGPGKRALLRGYARLFTTQRSPAQPMAAPPLRIRQYELAEQLDVTRPSQSRKPIPSR